MGFQNKNEIERALKKLEKSDGTLALRPDASPLEKFRWDLCQKFHQLPKLTHLVLAS